MGVMGAEANTSIRKQLLIAGCLYVGQLIVGYNVGWTAPVLAKLQNPDETPLGGVINDAEAAWIVSVIALGSVLGPYLSGYLCNAIGRKPCLYLGGAIFMLSFIILAVAPNLATIYAGRTLTGVGTGILFVINLVYIGEMASTRIRGTLLTLTGFSNTVGVLLAYSVGPFVAYSWISWIGVVICGVYLVLVFFFVTETAVYQVMKDKKDEAMANLTSLGRQEDIDEIVAQANEKPKSNMAQLTEMYTVRSNRKAAFIIICLNIMQQASGVIAVMSFVTIIFDMTGSNMESHISTIIIGLTQVFAAIFAPILVEKTGRRILLLVSTAGCSLSLAALGVYFHLYMTGHPAADDLQWLSLVSIMLFFISYFSGFGIIPNTFIGEMFTDTCRGFGGTFTVTIGWVFGFGVSTAFGYMWPALGPAVTFWIFSGACAFSFLFSVVFVPETKGKSLLEIQEILDKKDEAMANLTSLGRQEDIDEIVAQANEKPKSNMAQLTEMYTVRSNRKAAFIIICLNIMQQASGVIAVMSFVTIIFDMTGSNMESHISTIIIGLTQVFAAIFAPILVEKTGRRILLLVSTAGCSLSLAALGVYFHLYMTGHPAADDLQWLSLVSIMLFFISYFSGFGIIPNTFIGEMFTDTCRGFGGTFTVTIGWVFGFGVSTAFGYMWPALGPAVTFWIFSGACAFSFLFSVVFVPETKGKSLLEIQEILGR